MITIFQFKSKITDYNEATEVKISDRLLSYLKQNAHKLFMNGKMCDVMDILQAAHKYNVRLAEEKTTFSDLNLPNIVLNTAEQLRQHEIYTKYFWNMSKIAQDIRLSDNDYRLALLNTVIK